MNEGITCRCFRSALPHTLLYPVSLARLRTLRFLVSLGVTHLAAQVPSVPTNVLFIAVDDMNDLTTLFDASNPIRTPHLRRLADRGVLFTQAHATSPACNPSRTSVLSGLRPSTTGVYGNSASWRTALAPAQLLPALFRDHGYRTFTAGKIFHHHKPEHADYTLFEEALPFPAWPPDAPMPPRLLNGPQTLHGRDGSTVPAQGPNFDWGVWPDDPANSIDARTVTWAEERLGKLANSDRPFFLAVGIFRPHAPHFAPREYFDLYPLDSLQPPATAPDDLDDLPPEARALLHRPDYRWFSSLRHETERDPHYLRKAVQAYYAASSWADAQVGRLLGALDRLDLAQRTIVVLWSDHGYFLGQKERWEKFALYDAVTRVPLLFAGPGVPAGERRDTPVSLVDLFPTLAELTRLPIPRNVDGTSLVPLLRDPAAPHPPAITTFGHGNHSVRTREYRYTRYRGGDEELYHSAADPHEWHNLAGEASRRALMDELARSLPKTDAPPTPPAR